MMSAERRKQPWQLLALNLVLLAILGIVSWMPQVTAQFRPKDDTLVVAGQTGNGTEQVLWMLDIQAMELIAVGWDRAGKGLVPLDRRDVAQDVETLRNAR